MKVSKLIYLILVLLAACVPQRKFEELNNRHNSLVAEKDSLDSALNKAELSNKTLIRKNDSLSRELFRLRTNLEETEAMYAKVKKTYEQLEENYKKIIEASSVSQADLMNELKELERKLQKKEDELNQKEAGLLQKEVDFKKLETELNRLDNELKLRERKVIELQRIIRQKDSATIRLKRTLTESLLSYKESGLSVRQENGKVYVSLDERLLFQSGRTDVDKGGKDALLKLCETLRKEKDFDIMVEGHTDDVPIKTARFEDNWDLSVLRATSVVRIMTDEGGINAVRIIPSGRGQYVPVDEAKTKEARAKNRRIEVIIYPNLAELMKILEK
jgi:chemotaxis protein MotB